MGSRRDSALCSRPISSTDLLDKKLYPFCVFVLLVFYENSLNFGQIFSLHVVEAPALQKITARPYSAAPNTRSQSQRHHHQPPRSHPLFLTISFLDRETIDFLLSLPPRGEKRELRIFICSLLLFSNSVVGGCYR